MLSIVQTSRSQFQLTAELVLPRPIEEVFPFFSDARNLERLTPPWLSFRIVTPGPLAMRAGLLIAYRLKIHGMPVGWRSRISVWEPPRRFVDEQIAGPYRRWVHEHVFEPRGGSTLCRDRVDYEVPGGAWVHRLLVRRQVEGIFRYRAEAMQSVWGSSPGTAREGNYEHKP